MSFLCFKSSSVVNGLFKLCLLEKLRKCLIQPNALNFLGSENFDYRLSNMFSGVNASPRISLIFFFFISGSSQFSIYGRLSTTYYQPHMFQNCTPKIGWTSFCRNLSPFDKRYSFDFIHPITNKSFVFSVIF